METLSVAFNDSYDVLCFDLYLINKLGRYTIYKGQDAETLCSNWHFIDYLLLLTI